MLVARATRRWRAPSRDFELSATLSALLKSTGSRRDAVRYAIDLPARPPLAELASSHLAQKCSESQIASFPSCSHSVLLFSLAMDNASSGTEEKRKVSPNLNAEDADLLLISKE